MKLIMFAVLLQCVDMTKLYVDRDDFHVEECRIWGDLEFVDGKLVCRWFFTAVTKERQISYEDELDGETQETVRPELSCVDLPISGIDSKLFGVQQSHDDNFDRTSSMPEWSLYAFDHAECSKVRFSIKARGSDSFFVRCEGKTMPILGSGQSPIVFSLEGIATFDGLILRHECTSGDRPDSRSLLGLVNKYFANANYILKETSFEAYDSMNPDFGDAIYRFGIGELKGSLPESAE